LFFCSDDFSCVDDADEFPKLKENNFRVNIVTTIMKKKGEIEKEETHNI
jgi:hypothetical protein